ncbi:dTMP kinase [Gracilinema caldarium]|uniref:dTMP kinase n=1 Tax=Gracilinema caldarium TaxID=215591 RepID=UPI0026F295BF|nr:dTMP kinase [Gracilinema caldarium]
MILQNFVVLEGGDGTGTSTQLQILRGRLAHPSAAANIADHDLAMVLQAGPLPPAAASTASPLTYFTFEPTDGPIGSLIRQALHRSPALHTHTIAHLFAADRYEHLYGQGGIVERCRAGELVICDRYVPSSLVYQGISCGDDTPEYLNEHFPYPELILFFELDPEIAEQRYGKREKQDMFEHLAFQKQVHEAYERILPDYCQHGTRLVCIDAGKTIEEVAEQVWRALQNLPIFKR